MVIQQGDVYWYDVGDPKGRGLAYRHPHVVVQGNPFNRSKVGTVVICGISSNLKRAETPGNVLLKKGDANLPKESVVIVTQLHTVDRNHLSERIGSLSADQIEQVLRGVKMVLDAE